MNAFNTPNGASSTQRDGAKSADKGKAGTTSLVMGETGIAKYQKALTVLEYDQAASKQYKRLEELPDEYTLKFLETLENDPKSNVKSLVDDLFEQHKTLNAPYDGEHLNMALAEMRKLGSEAEQEFRKAVEVIGEDRVDTKFVCEQISDKFTVSDQVELPERFGQQVSDLTDATEVLEIAGYKLHRSGSTRINYEYRISKEGMTLRSGFLPYNVVAFANDVLRGAQIALRGSDDQKELLRERYGTKIIHLSEAYDFLEMQNYKIKGAGDTLTVTIEGSSQELTSKQLIDFANQRLEAALATD